MTKKIIALLLIIALVILITGCVKHVQEKTAEPTTATENQIQNISEDLTEIEGLEEDINFSELDNLDQELDEVNW